MKHHLILSLALALMFPVVPALSAADTSDSDPGSLKTDFEYFPLKYGSRWVYKEKNSSQSFIVKVAGYQNFTIKQKNANGVIVSTTIRCARLETTMIGKKVILGSELIGISGDGVYRYKVGDQTVDPPARILPIPCNNGVSWKIDSKIQDRMVRLEYAIDEDKITAPIGSAAKPTEVNALRLKANDFRVDEDKVEATVWYAKDIGMVKLDMQTGGVSFALELEKTYSIEDWRKHSFFSIW